MQCVLFEEDEPNGKQVRDTSKAAYHTLLRHPSELNGRYHEILDALKTIGHPATDRELTRFLGKMDPNYVRPRRNELASSECFSMPLVEDAGKRVCSVSGITAHIWWFTPSGLETINPL